MKHYSVICLNISEMWIKALDSAGSISAHQQNIKMLMTKICKTIYD